MSTDTKQDPREYLQQQRQQAEQRQREAAQQRDQARVALLASLAAGEQPDLDGELQVAEWSLTELGEHLETYLQRREALASRDRSGELEQRIAKAQQVHQAAMAKRDEILRGLDAEVLSAYSHVQDLESERIGIAGAERILRETCPPWITEQLEQLHTQAREIQAELDELSPHVGQQEEVEANQIRDAEGKLHKAKQTGENIDIAESYLDAVRRDIADRNAKREQLHAQADQIRQQIDDLNQLAMSEVWPTK